MPNYNVLHGDCLAVMRTLDANSIDAIVSDPPYGLSFMGKAWDHGVPGVEFWTEALRVAKPGTHLVAFGGTRTFHRLAVAIEDAGWEIRDCLSWLYGSGFPKSLDVSKAMDNAAGVERDVIGTRKVSPSDLGQNSGWNSLDTSSGQYEYTAPATDLAKQWAGWGTALKPAWEPIILARKPLVGTVAANVTQYGTGAINVDATRIAGGGPFLHGGPRKTAIYGGGLQTGTEDYKEHNAGRWPANVVLNEDAAGLLGEPSRFFYCAKASRREREAGDVKNVHPTVKPIALMRWLCRLVTPPNGTVLDPFNGSGSTGCAAVVEGFDYIGIELDAEYVEIAKKRIGHWANQRGEPDLFG